MATRDVKLIAIGNSKGIRLPKVLLQKYGWGDSLVLEETEEGIFLYSNEKNKLSGKKPTAPWRLTAKTGAISILRSADGLD